jgi:hypothetical protein
MSKCPLRLARPLASALVLLSLVLSGCDQGGTVAVAGGKEIDAKPAKPPANAAKAEALKKLENSPEVKKHAKLR